jgi:hypothetical protein
MTNPQALTAAARAMARQEFAGANFDHWRDDAKEELLGKAEGIITAYLNALPPINEGKVTAIIALIRGACTDWDDKPQADGEEPRSILNCYEMRQIADTIQHLSAKLAEQGEGK